MCKKDDPVLDIRIIVTSPEFKYKNRATISLKLPIRGYDAPDLVAQLLKRKLKWAFEAYKKNQRIAFEIVVKQYCKNCKKREMVPYQIIADDEGLRRCHPFLTPIAAVTRLAIDTYLDSIEEFGKNENPNKANEQEAFNGSLVKPNVANIYVDRVDFVVITTIGLN